MKIYPMIRKDLDDQAKEGKENCECGAPWQAHLMGLSQGCHPGIGLLIGYQPEVGCLLLTCPACNQSFGMIQVAKQTDDIFKGIEQGHILGMIVTLFENAHPDAPDEPPDDFHPSQHPSRN